MKILSLLMIMGAVGVIIFLLGRYLGGNVEETYEEEMERTRLFEGEEYLSTQYLAETEESSDEEDYQEEDLEIGEEPEPEEEEETEEKNSW